MNMKYVIPVLVFTAVFCVGCIGTDDSKEFTKKGNELFEEEKYSESIEAFDKAIELNPQNADSYNFV